ncbi:hypothetical protein ATANTOWER_010096 [Ataeniobius toweri]|uniref:Uncharacterized protein n=1 Tax=Ataeniobius toweri TaxID=208326 RepID=A0ABU7C7D7_9TELE|nr:hypothetical protein [Ataeniobius toweri]
MTHERGQPKTQPDKKKQAHTITLSHPHTYICKHSHPHTKHKDTQEWTPYTHSHSPYTIYSPRSRHRYPSWASSCQTQVVVPSLRGLDSGGRPIQRAPGGPQGCPGKPGNIPKIPKLQIACFSES